MPALPPVFQLRDLSSSSRAELDRAQAELSGLLAEREQAFGFNPDIVTDHPDLPALLADPAGYIARRCAGVLAASGRPVARVILLTTFADRLSAPLLAAGYRRQCIDMPAGPDHTAAFVRDLPPADTAAAAGNRPACALYLEAVDEQDEKIRPTFVLSITDADGLLLAGMSGALHQRGSRTFAYIGTVVARAGAPRGLGGEAAAEVLRYLRTLGVVRADLGTQTAEDFYRQQGFRVVHRLVPRLRHRSTPDGRLVHHDLVMMSLPLD